MRATPVKFIAGAIMCFCVAVLTSDSTGRQVSSGRDYPVHHDLNVTLNPEGHRLNAADRVTLPEDSLSTVRFDLHSGLQPEIVTSGVTLVKESEGKADVPVASYRVTLPRGTRTFTVKFQGEIYHPLTPHGAESGRGFRHTPGMIAPEGVYLTGESYWYPRFGHGLITFDVELQLP